MLCSDQADQSTETGARANDSSLLTEVYLLTANVEAEIEQYLLENGVTIDPKTRLWLANLRNAMATMAMRAKAAAGDADALR